MADPVNMADRWILYEHVRDWLSNATEGKRALPKEDAIGWVPVGVADIGDFISREMYTRPSRSAGVTSIHASTSRICNIMEKMIVAKSKINLKLPLERSWLDPPTSQDNSTCALGFHVGRQKPDRGIPKRDKLDLDDARACLIAVRQTWKAASELAQLISSLLAPNTSPQTLNLSSLIDAIRELTNQPGLDEWLRGAWRNRCPHRTKTSAAADNAAESAAQLFNMYSRTKLYLKIVRHGLEVLQSGLAPLKLAIDCYLHTLKNIQASVMAGDAFSADFGLNEMDGALGNMNLVWNDVIRPHIAHLGEYEYPAIQPKGFGHFIYDANKGVYYGERGWITPQHAVVASGISHIELQNAGNMIGLFHITEGDTAPRLEQRTGGWKSGSGEYHEYHRPQFLIARHLAIHQSAMSGIQFGKSSYSPNAVNNWQRDMYTVRMDEWDGSEYAFRTTISYPRRFNKPPYVRVWIMGFETSDKWVGYHTRAATTMRVSVDSADESSFRCSVHLSMSEPDGGETVNGPFEIGWMAVEPGGHDHELYMDTIRLMGPTTEDAGTRIDFNPHTFHLLPAVWCGLKSIRWNTRNADSIVSVQATCTSYLGTLVHFTTWNGGHIIDAEVTVIAMGGKIQSFD